MTDLRTDAYRRRLVDTDPEMEPIRRAPADTERVATPGVQVNFLGDAATVHTVTSRIFPTGSAGMPFDSGTVPNSQQVSVTLTTP